MPGKIPQQEVNEIPMMLLFFFFRDPESARSVFDLMRYVQPAFKYSGILFFFLTNNILREMKISLGSQGLTTASLNGGWVPGKSRSFHYIGSQLLDGDCSHGWENPGNPAMSPHAERRRTGTLQTD